MSGLGYIAPEPDTMCAYCGIITECRPYGFHHEQICFECAMTPEHKDITEQRMEQYIFGNRGKIINEQ